MILYTPSWALFLITSKVSQTILIRFSHLVVMIPPTGTAQRRCATLRVVGYSHRETITWLLYLASNLNMKNKVETSFVNLAKVREIQVVPPRSHCGCNRRVGSRGLILDMYWANP